MEIVNKEFEDEAKKVFEEFLTSKHQSFLLETRNREKIFNYFKNNLKNEENKNFFLNLKLLDIAKVREILEFGKTSFDREVCVVISFYSAGREAQNALLKFLEEVPENLKVIFIIHTGANIIKTIISRVYKLEIKNEEILEDDAEEEFYKSVAEKFLKTKPLNRIKIKEVVEILSKKDEYALENEDKERNDRESLEKFLLSIYEIVLEKYNANYKLKKEKLENEDDFLNKKTPKENLMNDYQKKELLTSIEEIGEYIKYAKNNSSSGKTIIDYLALRLPEISLEE